MAENRVIQWQPPIKPTTPPHVPGDVPAGYRQLDKYTRVYVSDKWLLVTGTPDESEDEETGHNCDAMGCGWEHVLYCFPLPTPTTPPAPTEEVRG